MAAGRGNVGIAAAVGGADIVLERVEAVLADRARDRVVRGQALPYADEHIVELNDR